MTLFGPIWLKLEIHKSTLQVVLNNGNFLMVHYVAILYMSYPEHDVFKELITL